MRCGDSEANPNLKIPPLKFPQKTTVSPSLNPVRYGAVKFPNAGTCSVAKTRGCAYVRRLADSNNVFSSIELPVVRIVRLEHGMLV